MLAGLVAFALAARPLPHVIEGPRGNAFQTLGPGQLTIGAVVLPLAAPFVPHDPLGGTRQPVGVVVAAPQAYLGEGQEMRRIEAAGHVVALHRPVAIAPRAVI